MKLAFVTAFPADPSAPRGGVEAVSVTLVDALLRFPDLDVHVVTTGGHDGVLREEWGRATVHRLPRASRWMLTGALGADRRQVSRYVHALAPDVIHAHDTFGLMVKGLPIARVFTIHGFIHADTRIAGRRLAWVRSLVWQAVEQRGWADHPHIISISPYVRERLRGIATGVIHDIENPISRSFFDIRSVPASPVVFSAAAICTRKNTLGLVDAFARIPRAVNARLRLAGTVTEPAYGDAVRDRIRQYGLESRVDLLGSISSGEVARELASASVFALVSFEENAPLGVEEAMAAGVPVVTSNRCGMPYLVRHRESGILIDPADPGDIAKALGDVLTDPGLRAALSQRARAFALERFHPDMVARRTRAVYYRAAAQPVASHASSGTVLGPG